MPYLDIYRKYNVSKLKFIYAFNSTIEDLSLVRIHGFHVEQQLRKCQSASIQRLIFKSS